MTNVRELARLYRFPNTYATAALTMQRLPPSATVSGEKPYALRKDCKAALTALAIAS